MGGPGALGVSGRWNPLPTQTWGGGVDVRDTVAELMTTGSVVGFADTGEILLVRPHLLLRLSLSPCLKSWGDVSSHLANSLHNPACQPPPARDVSRRQERGQLLQQQPPAEQEAPQPLHHHPPPGGRGGRCPQGGEQWGAVSIPHWAWGTCHP